LLKNSNAQYGTVPPPSPHYREDDLFLEGGDILLDERDVYVGFSGCGSSLSGIDWLQQYLGNEYKVHTVKWLQIYSTWDAY